MTKNQEQTVATLGSLVGRSIYAIKLSNAFDGYNLIPNADRIGSPIKFAGVNDIKIRTVSLIELTDGTEAIQLNNDEKLTFGLNTTFNKDYSNTPRSEIKDIEDGFYTDYVKAATVANSINKVYMDRIKGIQDYITACETVLTDVSDSISRGVAAYNASKENA